MTKAIKTTDGPVRMFQWVIGEDGCDQVQIPPCKGVLVQVEGDLAGEMVVIYGGLNAALVPLESVTSTPALVEIPAVRFVRPDGPVGVTITIMGVL